MIGCDYFTASTSGKLFRQGNYFLHPFYGIFQKLSSCYVSRSEEYTPSFLALLLHALGKSLENGARAYPGIPLAFSRFGVAHPGQDALSITGVLVSECHPS